MEVYIPTRFGYVCMLFKCYEPFYASYGGVPHWFKIKRTGTSVSPLAIHVLHPAITDNG